MLVWLKLASEVWETAPAMLVTASGTVKSIELAVETPFVGDDTLASNRLVEDCRSNTGFEPCARVDPPSETEAF